VPRANFESLIKALDPSGKPMPANARKNLAKTYSEFLAIEAAARKAGMEDAPELRELLNWNRLRTIAEFYRRTLQEKYGTPAAEEIHAYYQQHLAEYERVNLARVLVPRESTSAPDKDDFEKTARQAADAARERLLKGMEAEQVQKDASAAMGVARPASTVLGKRKRTDLASEEAKEVFGLKPGGVTQVETEFKTYVIYKIIDKDAISEEQMKAEISRKIYEQKYKEAMTAVLDGAPAEYDEEYLQDKAAAASKGSAGPSSPAAH
jgi:hypothetical protein